MMILFFAQARQVTRLDSVKWEVSHAQSAESLWKWLLEQFPNLAPFQNSSRLACNEEYLGRGQLLQPSDVVALIPPVSGG